MSLYNQICGVNEFAPYVARLIGIHTECVPRFRDAYVNDDKELVLFARIGGGNRPAYEKEIVILQTRLPNYLRDYDDSFDNTFAYFVYSPRSGAEELVENILKAQGHYEPMEKFQKVVSDLKNGLKTDETEKVKELGRQIFSALNLEAGEE